MSVKVKLLQTFQILWREHINIHHLGFQLHIPVAVGFSLPESYKLALSWCKFFLSCYVFEVLWHIPWHKKGFQTSPKSNKVCGNTFISKSIALYLRACWCNSLWSVSLHQYKVFCMELWYSKMIGTLNSGFTPKKKRVKSQFLASKNRVNLFTAKYSNHCANDVLTCFSHAFQ